MITVKLFGTFRLDSGIQEMQLEAKTVKELYPKIMAEVLKVNPYTTLSMKDVKGCIVSIGGNRSASEQSSRTGTLYSLFRRLQEVELCLIQLMLTDATAAIPARYPARLRR